MSPTRAWYRFTNAADPAVADIHIIDFIGDWLDDYWGFGVTAKSFLDQLSSLADTVKTVRVHINSPGGDVFAALNIANALRDQQISKGRTVETIVDGLAASAATIVMMAGRVVRMSDNAMVMVHNPWTWTSGPASALRKMADELDAVRQTIVATYQWHSPLDAEALVALMDAETWMSADEALARGFATEKVAGLQAVASLRPAAVATLRIPEPFRARVGALLERPAPAPVPAAAIDVLAAVEAAGLTVGVGRELVAAALPMDQVVARIASATAARAAHDRREREITAACAAAKLPGRVALYLKSGLAVDDVVSDLADLSAQFDGRAEIDTALPSAGAPTPAAVVVIDPADIYRARNARASEK